MVRRHGFKHGNGESHIVLTFRVSLSEDESVVEEDGFTIDIFDHDDELLSATTNLLIPSEVRSEDKSIRSNDLIIGCTCA